jgi:hypothetical protein
MNVDHVLQPIGIRGELIPGGLKAAMASLLPMVSPISSRQGMPLSSIDQRKNVRPLAPTCRPMLPTSRSR